MMKEINDNAKKIKSQILNLIEEYYNEVFESQEKGSIIPVSGKLFDHREIQNITESALDGWFTTGRFNKEFENKLKEFIGVKHLITVNSGSSANLVAMMTLTSEELGSRAVKAGDEFITVAASFPTTINPLITIGAIPVFIDIDIPSYNIKHDQIESAISSKTKAIVIAHTLGNPFDIAQIKSLCEKHNLWLIEDCCDALGSKYNEEHVGIHADLATLSFYPAHHITTGEGGAVFTNNSLLKKIAESIRDWGRDCWCPTGRDNSCKKRFGWNLGELPEGYDHKYIYSRLGYNLKITDMQAALGLAQVEKLPNFIKKRKENFNRLKSGLKPLEDQLILPEAEINSDPSWFGFLVSVKPNSKLSRNEICKKLNERGINTRLLFAGDIRKQPYFLNREYKCHGRLENTEYVMNNTFWLGVAPLLNSDDIDQMITCLKELLTE